MPTAAEMRARHQKKKQAVIARRRGGRVQRFADGGFPADPEPTAADIDDHILDYNRAERGKFGESVARGVSRMPGLMAGAMLDMPRQAMEQSEILRMDEDYNPGPVLGAALTPMTGAMPFAARNAVGVFGGRLAATADKAALAKAEQMAAAGANRGAIWNDTGWFQDARGNWNFEIPDEALRVSPGRGKGLTSGPIEHPDVAAAYPQLSEMTTVVRPDAALGGAYFAKSGVNQPVPHILSGNTRSVSAHELQHAIDDIEGHFPGLNRSGGPEKARDVIDQHISPRDWESFTNEQRAQAAVESYKRLMHETKARNVQSRLDMTPEQRATTPPYLTEDRPRAAQIEEYDPLSLQMVTRDMFPQVKASGGRVQRFADGGFPADLEPTATDLYAHMLDYDRAQQAARGERRARLITQAPGYMLNAGINGIKDAMEGSERLRTTGEFTPDDAGAALNAAMTPMTGSMPFAARNAVGAFGGRLPFQTESGFFDPALKALRARYDQILGRKPPEVPAPPPAPLPEPITPGPRYVLDRSPLGEVTNHKVDHRLSDHPDNILISANSNRPLPEDRRPLRPGEKITPYNKNEILIEDTPTGRMFVPTDLGRQRLSYSEVNNLPMAPREKGIAYMEWPNDAAVASPNDWTSGVRTTAGYGMDLPMGKPANRASDPIANLMDIARRNGNDWTERHVNMLLDLEDAANARKIRLHDNQYGNTTAKPKNIRGKNIYADGGAVDDWIAPSDGGGPDDWLAPNREGGAGAFLSDAASGSTKPITNWWPTYSEMNHQAQSTMGSGYNEAKEALQEPHSGAGAMKFVKGVGKTALGALEYATSPINATYRTFVGEPVEKVTGIPKEYTEVAAQLATPGLGLTRLPARIPAAPSLSPVEQAATRLGVDLPRAVTTDNPVVQQFGKTATSIPFAGAPLRSASERAIADLGDAAVDTRAAYGTGSPFNAGNVARADIEEHLKSGPIKQYVEALYDRVDNMVIPHVVGDLPATRQVVSRIDARRANAALPESDTAKQLNEALARPGLNYEGVKDLRTHFGEMLDGSSPIPLGMSHGEIKQIYQSLSQDMKGIIGRAGQPGAVRAFEEANAAAARWADIRTDLARLLKTNSDEAMFDKIVGMAGSTSRADLANLARVRNAVSPAGWDEVASASIAKMGWPPGGVGFSPDAFLTAYKKLSPQGRDILFRSTGNVHAQALDDIATVSQRFKELNKFANPSGTAQHAATAGLAASATPLFMGHLAEPLSAIGTVVGARVLSQILAKPASARAMANWSNAYLNAAQNYNKQSVLRLQMATRALAATTGKQFPALPSLQSLKISNADEDEGGIPRPPRQ